MREVISVAEPVNDNRVLSGAVVFFSLALFWAAISFVRELFGVGDPTILALNAALGFAALAFMAVAYYRLFYSHRIVRESNNESRKVTENE